MAFRHENFGLAAEYIAAVERFIREMVAASEELTGGSAIARLAAGDFENP
jgi:hypothetical protein